MKREREKISVIVIVAATHERATLPVLLRGSVKSGGEGKARGGPEAGHRERVKSECACRGSARGTRTMLFRGFWPLYK